MRTPAFQGSSEQDWGLRPLRHADIYRQCVDAFADAFYYFVTHRRGAAVLRGLASRSGTQVKLSLGSGRYVPPGWIGLDRRKGQHIVTCDLRRPIPLDAGTVDALLAEHVLEHFPLDDVPVMLRDYCRVLKPGAPIRIVCPDATVVADLILGHENDRVTQQFALDKRIYRWSDAATWRMKSANRLSHQYGQHHSLVTPELGCDLLHGTGFTGIVTVSADESAYFGDVPTTHFKRFPDSKAESFVVEARRPIDGFGGPE